MTGGREKKSVIAIHRNAVAALFEGMWGWGHRARRDSMRRRLPRAAQAAEQEARGAEIDDTVGAAAGFEAGAGGRAVRVRGGNEMV